MQHNMHCVTHWPLKMKIGLYFCNILPFTYRSMMLDEVQKCALTIKRIIYLNVHRAVKVHPEFVIWGGWVEG